uniref:Uncharacterized protein n=1 Tax=Picea sitchensis TaxID=3332 RepID=A0A6B9XQC5_PICSI|nr:hypothetical protein Q903MT_gene3761 [Picea sitchensis]
MVHLLFTPVGDLVPPRGTVPGRVYMVQYSGTGLISLLITRSSFTRRSLKHL